ncbi:MAG: T9SS type A sorting domain-containing protein [Ignavibacteria bacterium]
MKPKLLFTLALFILSLSSVSFAGPKISFTELITNAERDAHSVISAKQFAIQNNLPVTILTKNKTVIQALGIENSKVVYSVITNPAEIYSGSYVMFFDEIEKNFDLSTSRIIYSKNKIIDNSGDTYKIILNPEVSGNQPILLIPDWTFDRVSAFNSVTGDLIDTAFIHSNNPNLQSPKMALQAPNNFIYVSDQISDLVQKYDTNGVYVGFFAPAGGVNTTIVDNMRGIAFRPNYNLLATVGSGANINTIQEFDLGGNSIGSFIPAGTLNSPFDIHYRSNDILVTNSGGGNDVIKYDYNGTFISNFITSINILFAQQIFRNENGNLAVCGFSTPSGLILFDSSGNYMRSLTGATGLRGAYLLGNGHYLVTNASGVHEIDSASGSLIRTVVTGTNFQYVNEYFPDGLVSVNNISTEIPEKYSLSQNYPNPFNPKTVINYELQISGNAKLTVYDVLGNEVAELVNEKQNAGTYSVDFDGSNFSSGVYFYRLNAGEFSETKRMMLLK